MKIYAYVLIAFHQALFERRIAFEISPYHEMLLYYLKLARHFD